MISLSFSIPSQVLHRPVVITGALPYGLMADFTALKVIWGLHCAMEDGEFFFHKLNIGPLVDQYGFAFIAPCLGNGYFINSPYEKQADFLQSELLPVLRTMLPLSPLREDNMLLGISMGGFGAAHWALSCPEIFRSVAAISSIFDVSIPPDERARKNREQRPLIKLFSDKLLPLLTRDKDGELLPDADIRPLYTRAAQEGAPHFALWYGTEDYLSLSQSVNFICNCRAQGIEVTEHTFPGGHNQAFWQTAINEAVAWLMKPHTAA